VPIEGGSFWLPNVKYAEVTGIDAASNKSNYGKNVVKVKYLLLE